jgi:large subunit ribosomal protein L24
MLLCPHCAKPTRVGHRFQEDGTKVRVCKHCNEVIDK